MHLAHKSDSSRCCELEMEPGVEVEVEKKLEIGIGVEVVGKEGSGRPSIKLRENCEKFAGKLQRINN